MRQQRTFCGDAEKKLVNCERSLDSAQRQLLDKMNEVEAVTLTLRRKADEVEEVAGTLHIRTGDLQTALHAFRDLRQVVRHSLERADDASSELRQHVAGNGNDW